ncbi:MAG: hypothetical protein EXX96DRAFT_528798 [Benjaminiella poitrasii]|nr:MAG: hypothetical protein EXX96DRAFT_528798 [Benjaminiella poitrasii]
MLCHNCGSNNSESDASSGTSYCIDCGTVLEENTIVSEVTFGEASNGKAILQGSFAGESGRIAGGGLMGRKRREGQEQAIDNGRMKIANIAHAIGLPERYRESAQRYYNLAVVNQFTRGRKSDHVAATCLYCVCRTEKSSHMLIDFSDLLQINVFTLGATFLKLCRVLNLSLPQVDPSIYISRFAVALDFGDYTQRVAQDAVRIVQRMDRDWITSGRRPAGICGACLLMAARMNGFRRTVKEMIYIVKVAEVTIQKRLQEFNNTESSKLSVRDFRTVWLDSRADPPSYQRNRKLEEAEAQSQADIDDANQESFKLLSSFGDNEEEDASTANNKGKSPAMTDSLDLDENAATQIGTQVSYLEDDNTQDTLVDNNSAQDYITMNDKRYNELSVEQKRRLTAMAKAKVAKERDDLLDPTAHDEERREKKTDNDEEEDDDEGSEEVAREESLSDVDDEEIEAMVLTPDEVLLKTKVWYNNNKDYLEEMAVRRMVEKEKESQPHARRGPRSKKNMPRASTPAEAAKQLMATKKISRKINQAVFDDLFETPESIAKIKERDVLNRLAAAGGSSSNLPASEFTDYEVVEESGDAPMPKGKKKDGAAAILGDAGQSATAEQATAVDEDDDEDDDDMDPDDMADDERFLREARANYALDDADYGDDYGDGYDDDY